MDQSIHVRTCKRCGIAKPLTEYAKASRCSGGRRSTCKPCRRDGEKKMVAEKACNSCGATKPISEFHRRSGSADGFFSTCKVCRKAIKAAEYQRNKAAVNARTQAYYRANRESLIAAATEWKRANPERVRTYSRIGYERNPAKAYVNRRRWMKNNPEREAENSSRQNARRRSRMVKLGPVDLDALWTGACGICARPMERDLKYPDPLSKSVDHIVPLAKGGTHEQSNLQWAHLVCNTRKGARLSV